MLRFSPVLAQQNPDPAAHRAADGRLLITAIRATEPVRIDGIFDEPFWSRAEPASDFTQSEPREGQPASERTVVRLAYDADRLYVAAYLYDSDPTGIVVNDIRKDFRADDQDAFSLILDTFSDRRNGYVFVTNAGGGRGDQQSANEGREVNTSWDAVWTVKTQRVPDGWTAEMAIPFRALRFARAAPGETATNGDGQADVGMIWGINFSRRIRRRNELSYWSPVPRAFALTRTSLAGTLAGLPQAAGGRDLRVKPYLAARTVRETGGSSFDGTGDAGVDFKLGVTAALTLDLTANPDFAQVEVDEQQVNLTQFSQFFPEKREFFLENSGVFYVGDAARANRLFQPPTPDEDLLLFFSRRIGLTETGREIPILGGARLTGRAGGFLVGALNTQTQSTDEQDANNYTVLRLRRNVFRTSDMGAIFMMRQNTDDHGDYNRVGGADFNLRLPGETDWNSYLIATAAPGAGGDNLAWRTSFNHQGNFFHGKVGYMSIGDDFVNDLGYYRRTGIHKWLADIGIRPRPESLRRKGIREMHPHITWDYVTDLDGSLLSMRLHNGYSFFFDNGALIELSMNPRFEEIAAPLRLHPDNDPLPLGRYRWREWMVLANTDASRPLSLTFRGSAGGLYNGTQRTVNSTLTVKPSYRVRVSLGIQRTDGSLDAPVGDFVRTIWTTRANYSFSPNMFVDAFAQYDPDRNQFNTNIRFNVIHRPLSDLFIVFNEQRITGIDAPAAGRSLILKVTRMTAF